MTMNRYHDLLRAASIVALLALAGCAAFSNIKQPKDEHSELYDGQNKLIHEAGHREGSAKDALARGDEALNQGDMDLALFEYVKAVELDDSQFEAFYKIGIIHLARGNLSLAQSAFHKTLARAKRHPGALEGMGLVFLQQRQYDGAEDYLNQAITADSQRWQAHNGLGIIADLQKQYALAVSHYQAALQIKPGFPLLLNNIGYSNYLAGNWGAAQRYLEQALKKNPNYKRAWENLGLLHARRGQYDLAKAAFLHVMDEAHALNNIGYLSMMEGRFDEAETFLSAAIALSPSYYATAYDNLRRSSDLRQGM